MKGLTVQQLARISGVTVRTLHYYDEVGLLKPSFVKENGYRYYDRSAQLKLQQILFFKELDFSLEQIQKMMKVSEQHRLELMEDQKKLLQLKRKRLERIIKTIESSINDLKGGESMKNSKQGTGDSQQFVNDDTQDSGQAGIAPSSVSNEDNGKDLFEAFDMNEVNQYHQEAKERWGNTEAWRQSQERTKHWTKADYQKLKEDGDRFMKEFATKVKFGADSREVQEDIDKMYKQLYTFYDPSIEMFRNLGQMYVDDPRFTAYYEKYAPGLAVFVRDAINVYCDRHEEENK